MTGSSPHFTVKRRLRPLRLAFLVRPDNTEALAAIFEANTCIWGGRYNGIVPVYRRTPKWWERPPLKAPAARDLLIGYLDAFEPDYVVETEPGLCKAISTRLSPQHVVNLEEVISATRGDATALGLSVIDQYRDLYERRFGFVQRHPPTVVLPLQSNPSMKLFTAMACGAFPKQKALDYFTTNYREAFGASDTAFMASILFACIDGDFLTPLRLGSAGLERRGRGMHPGPALFFMDATSTHDLIDFWNLRALGWRVVPVPRQWADELLDPCRRFVEENDVPYRHNPQMRQWSTLLKGRTVSMEELDAFRKRLALKHGPQLSTQHWYPRIWDEWARDKDHALRCEVFVRESSIATLLERGGISVAMLAPPFADRLGWAGKPRWANVLEIRDEWPRSDRALVLPPGVPSIERLIAHDPESVTVSSEGIVVRCEFADRTIRLELPDGFAAFRAWFAAQGIEARQSGAGLVATRLLENLGGIWQARLVADPEVVKLLDQMAHGLAERPLESDDTPDKKPKVRGKLVSREQWMALLQKVHKAKSDRARSHFRGLTNAGVLRVGFRLECPECHQANWYQLRDVSDDVRCERCLNLFGFPADNPPRDGWFYRTQGPFSVENYAQGGYAVAVALRFLTTTLHAGATWATGLELKEKSKEVLEADFVLFWRESAFWDRSVPQLIFGECKTFGSFESRDLNRARALATRFPGAVLAFVTLRDELTKQEKQRLARFARAGRRYLRAERWRTPVLVLTKHELVSEFGPPACWEDVGGKFVALARHYRSYGGLLELCDATQQLHLEMESYAAWHEQDMERWRQRQVARAHARRPVDASAS